MDWDEYCGHSIVWENKNGKTYFRDTQDINRPVVTDLSMYDEIGALQYDYIRLDNQLPESTISRNVEPRIRNKYGRIENEKVSEKEKYKPGLFARIYD
jgi:hypothetical protein